VVFAILSRHKELFSLITIVQMIIAHGQAQSQRKLQYVAKSAKIDAKKKKLLTLV
jgi:hypothetical protein